MSIEQIEKLFGVEITEVAHRTHEYTGDVTIDKCNAVIAANPELVEWQDAKRTDCGNGDGIMYLYYITEDESFCFDPATNEFSIC